VAILPTIPGPSGMFDNKKLDLSVSPSVVFSIGRKRKVSAGRALAACALSVFLAACAVGPDFEKPAAPQVKELTKEPMPAQTIAVDAPTGDAQRFLAEEPVQERWWLLYNSPELNRR